MEVQYGHYFLRGAPEVSGTHISGYRSDGGKDVRMLTGKGITHKTAIGHAAGIGALCTESVFLLKVLGQGHKEAVVICGASGEVGVPVRDVVDVVRSLRKDGDKPFLLCQRGESTVIPDLLGTAAVAVKNKD